MFSELLIWKQSIKSKWQKWKLKVPVAEAADAQGMATVRQHHLCTIFHANPTFIISLKFIIKLLPHVFHSLSAQNFTASALPRVIFQFNKLSLKQPKRVNSRDLWVVINNGDIIDTLTLARENLRRFYLYIEQLPLLMPETHAIVSDYMIWVAEKKLW